MSQGCLEERAQPSLRRSLQAASLRATSACCPHREGAAGTGRRRLDCKARTWVLSCAVPLCDLGGGGEAAFSLLCTSFYLVVPKGTCQWCVRTCAPSQALSRAVCSRGPCEVVSWASPCRERTGSESWSEVCHDVLCDRRQVTRPLWASSSPLHTREVIFQPSLCQGHERASCRGKVQCELERVFREEGRSSHAR